MTNEFVAFDPFLNLQIGHFFLMFIFRIHDKHRLFSLAMI